MASRESIGEVERPMKKFLLAILALFALAVWMTLVQAKETSKPPNFSGNWVLNFGQTKNPPDGLQGYNLVVNQDGQQLKVETTLQGDLQSVPNTPNSGGYPGGSGRRGGMGVGLGVPGGVVIGMGIPVGLGMPGVGMGIPRGGGGRSRSAGASQGNVAAYKIYPENVAYKLDSSEGTAQLRDRDQTNATSKAERAKDGEVLKLSLVGNGDSGNKGNKVQITEQWKLSEDRKSLKVDRTVKSPEGSGTVHLVFLKRESDTTSTAAMLVKPN
jgi:hypothetical protein